jgi:hypothetical protein
MYICSLCGAQYQYFHVCVEQGTALPQGVAVTTTEIAVPLNVPTVSTTITTTPITNDMIWRSWTTVTSHPYEARRVVEERNAEARRIEEKARNLFLSLLSDEQKLAMKNNHYVIETSPAGHRYMIRTNGHWTGNVRLLDGMDQPLADLCCHSFGRMPKYDQFAAQLLAIRYNEEEFIGVANVHMSWWDSPPEWFRRMRMRYRNARGQTYVYDEGAHGSVNVYYDLTSPHPSADTLAA